MKYETEDERRVRKNLLAQARCAASNNNSDSMNRRLAEIPRGLQSNPNALAAQSAITCISK